MQYKAKSHSVSFSEVVVTGVGIVSALGTNAKATWSALSQGISAADTPSRFSAESWQIPYTCEVRSLDFSAAVGSSRASAFANKAAREAIDEANAWELVSGIFGTKNAGLYLGVGLGGFDISRYAHIVKGCDEDIASFLLNGLNQTKKDEFEDFLRYTDPAHAVVTLKKGLDLSFARYRTMTAACAAGGQAIGAGFHAIQSGELQIALCGATESLECISLLGGFSLLGVIHSNFKAPPKALDVDRSGFAPGEGAAFLVLENKTHAQKRGAKILTQICGYGETSNAYRITDIPENADGAIQAMRSALEQAGLQKPDIVNAHATGTAQNDRLELFAIESCLTQAMSNSDITTPIWVCANKPQIGHLVAASGAIEAAISVLSIKNKFCPPTVNLTKPIPTPDWLRIPTQGKHGNFCSVLNNSFGFGGTNASLVFCDLAKNEVTRPIELKSNPDTAQIVSAAIVAETDEFLEIVADQLNIQSGILFAYNDATWKEASLPAKIRKSMGVKDQLGLLSASMAVGKAILSWNSVAPYRRAAFVATAQTQADDYMAYMPQFSKSIDLKNGVFDIDKMGEEFLQKVNPVAAARELLNGCLSHICQIHEIRGLNRNYMDGERGGVHVLEDALAALRQRQCDIALCGLIHIGDQISSRAAQKDHSTNKAEKESFYPENYSIFMVLQLSDLNERALGLGPTVEQQTLSILTRHFGPSCGKLIGATNR